MNYLGNFVSFLLTFTGTKYLQDGYSDFFRGSRSNKMSFAENLVAAFECKP